MISVAASRVDLTSIRFNETKRSVAMVVEIDLPPDVPEGSATAYAMAHVTFPHVRFDPLPTETPARGRWERLLGEDAI